MEDYLYLKKKKKKTGKFHMRIPLSLTGERFWPECNVSVFAWELLYSIDKGLRNKMKIL